MPKEFLTLNINTIHLTSVDANQQNVSVQQQSANKLTDLEFKAWYEEDMPTTKVSDHTPEMVVQFSPRNSQDLFSIPLDLYEDMMEDAKLTQREQMVQRLNLGLSDTEPKSFGEMSQVIGCSLERARELTADGAEKISLYFNEFISPTTDPIH